MEKELCPCCSGKTYQDCCGRHHQGELPETALQLMRSRYSAYVKRLESYLLSSWHPDHRPAAVAFPRDQVWLGLEVLNTRDGGADDDTGVVVRVAGRVTRVEDGIATVSLEVTCGGQKVLGMPKAQVELGAPPPPTPGPSWPTRSPSPPAGRRTGRSRSGTRTSTPPGCGRCARRSASAPAPSRTCST